MPGLILARTPGQSVRIGPDILITILERHGKGVRLSIEAPPEVVILRTELEAEERRETEE